MIFPLLWKATSVLGVALLALRALRHARASVRHAMLLAAFAAIAILPVAMLTMPSLDLAVLPAVDSSQRPASAGATARPGDQPRTDAAAHGAEQTRESLWIVDNNRLPNKEQVLAVAWLIGAAALLLPLVIGIVRVLWLRRSALPFLEARPLLATLTSQSDVRAPVDLVVHEAIAAPITCGTWRRTIVLPSDAHEWSAAALTRALVHELEHVRRRDWTTQVVARAICAVYWFHPLAWIAYRHLCLEAEHACDDAVVAREESTTYADQLVSLARRIASQPRVATLGMAGRSHLAARVLAVLDITRARGRVGAMGIVAVAAIAAAGLLVIAPLQIVEAEASTAPATEQQRSSPRLNRALVEAAGDDDMAAVTALLAAGADVNATVSGDGSPLIAAARNGRIDIVRLLLERGADVDHAVLGDGAPLIMAAREGHFEIVRLLVDRGASIDQMVSEDENALIQASANGHLEIVRYLVERGADVNARAFAEGFGRRDDQWRTPLNMAIAGGHRAVAEFLRARGAAQ